LGNLRDYITGEYIKRLNAARLNVAAKTGAGAGARKSNAKGGSLEFSDFRDYSPGDDIRRVDWNSYGRLNKLFIKVFEEERQASVNIFIDKSKSMAVSERKYDFARLAAATLAYLALNKYDKVGFYCCDSAVSVKSGRFEGKNAFGRAVDFLNGIEAGGETALAAAVEQTLKTERLIGGISFLISDFFSGDDYGKALEALRTKGHNVALIHVLDKTETDPDLSDAARLVDAETGGFRDVFITSDVIKAYKAALAEFKSAIAEFCRRRGAAYVFARSDEDAIFALRRFYVI
jgi:uncharacterized protein (DUF58 family)